MPKPIPLLHHPSQFPERWSADLAAALYRGEVPPKYLYDSPRQVAAWLDLHRTCSPAATDPGVGDVYRQAAEAVIEGEPIHHVISLGCGGGNKDAALMRALSARHPAVTPHYTAVDVGAAMVLTALEAVAAVLPGAPRTGIVADLLQAPDLRTLIDAHVSTGPALLLLFGLSPNFTPAQLTRLLHTVTRPGDRVLLSANLAPGEDYRAGVEAVLPQYDNACTRRWLGCFVEGLGLEPDPARMSARVVADPEGHDLRRIEICRHDDRSGRPVSLPGAPQPVELPAELRLLYSYRYTPQRLRGLLAAQGFSVGRCWVSASGEECVVEAAAG